jgi:peptide/nickel transport system permease protein
LLSAGALALQAIRQREGLGNRRSMLGYLVHRILIMVPTLIAISIVVFIIINLPPGDYFSTYIAELQSQGEHANLAKIAFLEKQYGFDKPLWEQYLYWAGGLLHGDMGYSFLYDLPVNQVVGDRLLLTFIVSFTTILFTYIVAFPIGVYSATHQYSISDYLLTFVGFLGLATPSFLLALVLVYLAHVYFGISVGGLMDPSYMNRPWSWGKVLSVFAHIWIPVIVIGTAGTASMIRRLRANLLDELQKQYVVTARAKGLHPFKVLIKYPLRLSLNPFISDIGSLLPHVISGAAVVSVVMSLPTTGPMLLDALRSQDMYLAGSFLMFMAFLTVIGVFLSDLALAALDPRIRFQVGARP